MDCQQKHSCFLLENVIERDGMEWDYVHGKLPTLSGSCGPNNVDRKTKRGSRTLEDREPEKFSTEIGFVIEDRFNKSEDEDVASLGKKRKLSPSIRDLEQKKKNNFLYTKIKDITRARSPLPSPPAVDQHMEEEYCQVRGISLSRLADANNLVDDDEEAISAANYLARRTKNIPLTFSQDQISDGGEVIVGDGSERTTSNVSGSGELFQEVSPHIMDENDGLIVTDTKVNGCSFQTLKNVQPPCKSINMLQCCRSVDDFEKLNKINEGTYGIVYRARDKKSGEIVALKKVKMEKVKKGCSLKFLREINILLSLHHPSIAEIKEVVVGSVLDGIFIVMEYMEHDLKGLMKIMNKPFHVGEIKCLMLQLLSGVKLLHDNWVLHRDLKPSNLLFNNRGELKICDFGLSRHYDSPLKPYTKRIVTLRYRAPELLFAAKEYSTAIDMWSLGCIMAELLTKEPLFSGRTNLGQLRKMYKFLGIPDEKIWPGFTKLSGAYLVRFSKQAYDMQDKFPLESFRSFLPRSLISDTGFDLLSKLLTYDPEKRITAEEALNHPWFLESPLPISKELMPTFPVQHTQDRELC